MLTGDTGVAAQISACADLISTSEGRVGADWIGWHGTRNGVWIIEGVQGVIAAHVIIRIIASYVTSQIGSMFLEATQNEAVAVVDADEVCVRVADGSLGPILAALETILAWCITTIGSWGR